MQKMTSEEHGAVIERCLGAYLRAGTMELSLNQLGAETGTTKRMLVHYFGNRQEIERRAILLLMLRIEDQSSPEHFVSAGSLSVMVRELWDRITEPEFVPALRLACEVFTRTEKDDRALRFHDRVLQLWTEAIARRIGDPAKAERVAILVKMLALGFLSGPYDTHCRQMLEQADTL